jgi:hypothetical protein
VNYIPEISRNGAYICRRKDEALNGVYAKKLDYNPVSLINLIGNSKKHLNLLYTNILLTKLKEFHNNSDRSLYELNNNNNRYGKLREVIKNDENVFTNNAFNDMIFAIKNNIVTDVSIDINNYEYREEFITYKNPNFIENDEQLITLFNMSQNGILTDAILIHTFYLAYNFYNYINNKIFDTNEHIINNNIDSNTILNNEFNLRKHIRDNIYKDNRDKDDRRIKRLVNIFYKSVNICYNNKTDFSKNLIIYTKRAFDNYFNLFPYQVGNIGQFINSYKFKVEGGTDIKIITENNFGNFKNYITYIYDNKKELENDGFEIKFYDDNKNELDYIVLTNTENLNNIPEVINAEVKDKENKLNEFIERIKTNIKDINRISYYSLEPNEIKNSCNKGNVNLTDNDIKNCKKCEEVCDINTCKTNNKCLTQCKSVCDEFNEESNKDNKKYACGKVPINEEKKEDKSKKDYEMPLDADIQVPNFSKIFNYALKFIFIGIIIYIIYIFYNMFQETIWTIVNLTIYLMYYIFYKIYYIRDSNAYAFDMKIAEYSMMNNRAKFNKVNSKLKSM